MPQIWAPPDDPLVPEVRAAAETLELRARYADLDRQPRFPRAEFQALGARGLLGLTVPVAHGGRGLPLVRAAAVLFHLAYQGGTVFAKLSLQPEFCGTLLRAGSEAMVHAWFEPVVRGEALVGNQITEPGAGSDARAIALGATRDGSDYVLSGTKSEAAFAADAEAAIVYGRVAGGAGRPKITAFLVPQTAPGVTRGVDPADMGERWQRRGWVTYDRVHVPEAGRIGAEGDGFAPLLQELTQERGLLAAVYLGTARASLDEAIAYAGERSAFGRRISDNQAVAFPLVDALAGLESAWLLTREALAQLDAGAEAAAQTAMAKVVATDAALRAIDRALQFSGGVGYSSRLLHEQRYRDVRSGQIAHGTSEVLRQTAARTLWPTRPPP